MMLMLLGQIQNGWVLWNSKSAVEAICNKGFSAMISEEKPLEGETKTYNVTAKWK